MANDAMRMLEDAAKYCPDAAHLAMEICNQWHITSLNSAHIVYVMAAGHWDACLPMLRAWWVYGGSCDCIMDNPPGFLKPSDLAELQQFLDSVAYCLRNGFTPQVTTKYSWCITEFLEISERWF